MRALNLFRACHAGPAATRIAGLVALLMLLAAAPAWPAAAQRVVPDKVSKTFYAKCMRLARTNAKQALRDALAFDATGSAYPARHCAAVALRRLGRYADAAAMLEGVAGDIEGGAPRQLRSRLYHQAAQAWLRARQVARAEAALGRSIALDGRNTAARLDRGLLRAQTGQVEASIYDFDAVIKREPGNVTALVLRAAVHRKLKRLERASADLERVLALRPNHPDALLERGIVRLARRDLPGARADWRRLVRVAPRSAAAVVARRKLENLNRRLK